MPTKFSEKKLAIGISLFMLGLVVLLNTTLFASPVKVSEAGVLLSLLSVSLMVFGVTFFKSAKMKV